MEWEYHSFTRECHRASESHTYRVDHKRANAELNALGADGWELISVVPIMEEEVLSAISYFFKRERESSGERVMLGATR